MEAQHRKGKLSARERLEILLDAGSFEEMGSMVTHRCTDFGLDKDLILGDGVVTGLGKINGMTVAVFHKISRCLGIPVGDPCRENREAYGSGPSNWGSFDWA